MGNTHTKKTSQLSSRTWALVTTAFVIACLALTALIYGFLIWTNCESQGIADFFADVRDFHTYDGC